MGGIFISDPYVSHDWLGGSLASDSPALTSFYA